VLQFFHDDHHLKGIAMKVSREQMAANRERILEAASALFRERGFESVTVAEVMKQAGMTHGGFYGHFSSKEALAAEAAAHMLGKTAVRWSGVLEAKGHAGLAGIIDAYLSRRHRDHPGAGCPIVALGADVARQPEQTKEAFAAQTRAMLQAITPFMPGDTPALKTEKAQAVLAQMVGAVVLARALGRNPMSEEILAAARKAIDLPAH
jgi:TetR/AcrR family transcriptional repressor of nem operon